MKNYELSIAFQTGRKMTQYALIGKKVENFGFDRPVINLAN